MCGCSVPEECPQEAVDLYRRCIITSAQARPTASELVQRLEQLRLLKAYTAPASTERTPQTSLISPIPSTPGARRHAAAAAPALRLCGDAGERGGPQGDIRGEDVGAHRGPGGVAGAPAPAAGESSGAVRGPQGEPKEGRVTVQRRLSAPYNPADNPSPAEGRPPGRATYGGPSGEQGPGPARPGNTGAGGHALKHAADPPLPERASADADDRAGRVLQAMQARAAARETARAVHREL